MPPKVRIDKEGDNKAAASSKGEEEHQIPKGAPPADAGNRGPLRAITSRRGRPVQGCTPPDRRKQIYSGKFLSANTKPAPSGTCGSIKKAIERIKSSSVIIVR